MQIKSGKERWRGNFRNFYTNEKMLFIFADLMPSGLQFLEHILVLLIECFHFHQ